VDELPYAVRMEEEDGQTVYVLEDVVARSEVWVAPSLGFNAYRFSVEPEDHGVAIIDPPPTLAELAASPAGYGMPVLFPFPGRIPGGRFRFAGRQYKLEKSEERDYAIHGFVMSRPWQVVAWATSVHDGAVLVGRLESPAFPELAGQYPSAFRLDLTYRLRAWALTVEARAENIGSGPLPVGYGLHPYLHVPLDHGLSAGGCLVAVPATRRWELAGLVPTGRLLPLEEDVAAGVSLEGRTFDEVYTGLLLTQGASRAVLSDTEARLAVVVEADREFRNWVVYTPPRLAVCLEPWTCTPNAINLQAQGIDAGLTLLHPGEWHSWTVRLRVHQV
jgi:aldose 1-epimerase